MATRPEEQLLGKFEAELRHRGSSELTIESYLGRLRVLVRFVGIPLAVIEFSHIKRYFIHFSRIHSPSTERVAIHAFQAFFNDHLDRKFNFDQIPRRPSRSRQFEVMPGSVYEQLLKIPQPEWMKLMLSLMYEHGLDPGEALTIRRKDVLVNKQITYKPRRSQASRYLTLTETQYSLAQNLLDQHKSHDLFVSRLGSSINSDQVASTLKRLLQRCGVQERYTTKSMRNAYVINQFKKGFELNRILKDIGVCSGESLKAYHGLVENLGPRQVDSSLKSASRFGDLCSNGRTHGENVDSSLNSFAVGGHSDAELEHAPLDERIAAMEAKLSKLKMLREILADSEMAGIARQLLAASNSGIEFQEAK